MATPRKLTQEQEREVTLAYLCGVDTEKIQEKYGVSDATTRASIVGKRSREWNDPLVEFYRETNGHNRDRNAVHCYLAFQDLQDVPCLERAELVDAQRDQAVKDIVEESLYHPGIDQIVKWTALDHYVAPKTSLGWATIKMEELDLPRGNPYEHLLEVIAGHRNEDELVTTVLTRRLFEEYQAGGPSSLQTVFPQVAYDIMLKIKEGGLGITPTKKKIIEEVLQTLTERERKVLGMRFGLDGYNKSYNIDEIGQDFQVTRERIRQIEAKAIRKLRHPSKVHKLEPIVGLCTEYDAQNYLANIQREIEREKWKHELYPEIEQRILFNIARDRSLKQRVDEEEAKTSQDRLNHSIEELELSIRTHNCLLNQGIKTIGDILKYTEVDLLRTKNFGRKSLKELKEVLEPYGVKLA